MKVDTLFPKLTLKMTPYSRKKQSTLRIEKRLVTFIGVT